MKICFVCQGNIIRSPLAENLFRYYAEKNGVAEHFIVDSAGTSAYHVGEPPDHRMRQVASNKGFEYSGKSRQFQRDEFKNHDLIIAMDRDNFRVLKSWAASPEESSKLRMMREFGSVGGAGLDVPDPYYGGIDGFDITYEIVKNSVEALFKELEGGLDRS